MAHYLRAVIHGSGYTDDKSVRSRVCNVEAVSSICARRMHTLDFNTAQKCLAQLAGMHAIPSHAFWTCPKRDEVVRGVCFASGAHTQSNIF